MNRLAAPAARCPPLARPHQVSIGQETPKRKIATCQPVRRNFENTFMDFEFVPRAFEGAAISDAVTLAHFVAPNGQTFAFCTIGAVESPFYANFQGEAEYALRMPKK
jgi:hypothetical protein